MIIHEALGWASWLCYDGTRMPETISLLEIKTDDPEGSIFLPEGDKERGLSPDHVELLRRCGACLLQRANPPAPDTQMCAAEAESLNDTKIVVLGWRIARVGCRSALEAGGRMTWHGIQR